MILLPRRINYIGRRQNRFPSPKNMQLVRGVGASREIGCECTASVLKPLPYLGQNFQFSLPYFQSDQKLNASFFRPNPSRSIAIEGQSGQTISFSRSVNKGVLSPPPDHPGTFYMCATLHSLCPVYIS